MKKIYKNPWFITIFGTLLGSFIIYILQLTFDIKVINDIWYGLRWFFTISVPIWIFLLVVLLVILQLKGKLFTLTKIESIKKPDWLEYTEDIFEGNKYEWEYGYTGNKYKPINFRSYCLVCDYQIIKENGLIFCPHCHTYKSPLTDNRLNIEIEHKIRTGKYK